MIRARDFIWVSFAVLFAMIAYNFLPLVPGPSLEHKDMINYIEQCSDTEKELSDTQEELDNLKDIDIYRYYEDCKYDLKEKISPWGLAFMWLFGVLWGGAMTYAFLYDKIKKKK